MGAQPKTHNRPRAPQGPRALAPRILGGDAMHSRLHTHPRPAPRALGRVGRPAPRFYPSLPKTQNAARRPRLPPREPHARVQGGGRVLQAVFGRAANRTESERARRGGVRQAAPGCHRRPRQRPSWASRSAFGSPTGRRLGVCRGEGGGGRHCDRLTTPLGRGPTPGMCARAKRRIVFFFPNFWSGPFGARCKA